MRPSGSRVEEMSNHKQSGIGRELGTYGYEAYTEVKQISTCLAPQKSGWFKGVP